MAAHGRERCLHRLIRWIKTGMATAGRAQNNHGSVNDINGSGDWFSTRVRGAGGQKLVAQVKRHASCLVKGIRRKDIRTVVRSVPPVAFAEIIDDIDGGYAVFLKGSVVVYNGCTGDSPGTRRQFQVVDGAGVELVERQGGIGRDAALRSCRRAP